MTPEEIHPLVVGTGRLSAALFVAALFSAGMRIHALRFWTAFVTALTLHFAAVLWFATATGGRNLFPGGRSLEDVGGWPTVLAIVTFTYVLAFIGLAARRAGSGAERWLRTASHTSTSLIWLLFLAAYAPLITSSTLFALPVVVLVGAFSFYLAQVIWQPSGQSS